MENLNSILLVIQVLLSISLIALILLQHGKGADAGAAFGSGASSTVFGARGSGNFMSRATAIIATLFFIVCLSLAYLAANRDAPDGISGSVISDEISNPVLDSGDLPPADETGNDGLDLPPAE